MTAPVGRVVAESREPVRDAMVDLLLLGISLCVRFTDTLGDDARVAFVVAGVLAVLALHTRATLQEFGA